MLQLNFNSIYEAQPGEKWQKLFNTHWPAYKAWFESKGAANHPNLEVSQRELKQYMPEFIPTYERLCELAGNDPIAMRFLTGYQPPAYIAGCSQAVLPKESVLIRNYDYHPHLSEGTLLNSAWNGKHVIAVGDCLSGVVDGMNTDGLVASLTFGGRKVVGEGFGIPFIMRYVLEFCEDVQQAVEALKRIPSHMAYNVMVLDKSGAHKMIQLAPDKKPLVTDLLVSTNHQGQIDWPEHARFTKTLERNKVLSENLLKGDLTTDEFTGAFLKAPLFNRQYNDGFGTVYTSVYRPKNGEMELKWEDKSLRQSFADFQEGNILITYTEKEPAVTPKYTETTESKTDNMQIDYWKKYGESWASGEHSELAVEVVKTIGNALAISGSPQMEKLLQTFTSEAKKRGQIPWEMLADIWAGIGSEKQENPPKE